MAYKSFLTITLVMLAAAAVRCDYTEQVDLDDLLCNGDETKYIYNHDKYYVRWNGLKNPDCKLRFVPSDTNGEVCIKTIDFDINDCSVDVNYFSSFFDSDAWQQSYSCMDSKPDKFCGKDFETVSIKINSNQPLDNPGTFDLKVYTKSSNVGLVIGLSVGIPVVVLVITITTVIVLCCVHRRRKNKKGMLLPNKHPRIRCPPYTGYQSVGGYQQGFVNRTIPGNNVQQGNTCPHCQGQLPS